MMRFTTNFLFLLGASLLRQLEPFLLQPQYPLPLNLTSVRNRKLLPTLLHHLKLWGYLRKDTSRFILQQEKANLAVSVSCGLRRQNLVFRMK